MNENHPRMRMQSPLNLKMEDILDAVAIIEAI